MPVAPNIDKYSTRIERNACPTGLFGCTPDSSFRAQNVPIFSQTSSGRYPSSLAKNTVIRSAFFRYWFGSPLAVNLKSFTSRYTIAPWSLRQPCLHALQVRSNCAITSHASCAPRPYLCTSCRNIPAASFARSIFDIYPTLESEAPVATKALQTCWPMASATAGGNAFPIWRWIVVFPPQNIQSSGKS